MGWSKGTGDGVVRLCDRIQWIFALKAPGHDAGDEPREASPSGYVEGQNVTVEYRWLEGRFDRLAAVLDDLLRRRVAVIATPGAAAARKPPERLRFTSSTQQSASLCRYAVR
jgi:hypothetical protein